VAVAKEGVLRLRRLFSGKGPAQGVQTIGSLGHNKLCCVEDFAHPDLTATIRAVFPHDVDRFGPGFPIGREYRKHWEVAMAARALGDLGVLHDRAEVLGVGAGHEPTIFWLTTKVARVFSTDLYLDPGVWSEFASGSMLTEPGRHWPSPWNPRRLVAQHMNGLDLQYEDDSFDAIFSSSSIEHFGTLADVRRAAAEMCRVLKPGGVLSLSTEYRLEGPSSIPGVLLFDADGLREHIIGTLPWSPVSPLDLKLSPATRQDERDLTDYVIEWREHFAQHGGLAVWHALEFRTYPQILLRHGESLFTSVHLALRKHGRAA
jgi:SAM-dependent methyltransferase